MKVETRVMDYTSTVEGEKVGMTIDQGALSHIMSVLTDLYSDPEAAVIREYSTNARDAQVSAGEGRPIEVTLPSPMSPFFKVRDYGAGLNADDIREIFSRYGASTKRDSNDVVGMLGLGCKSALTYTDQFTVTGHRDGVTTEVLVSRDEDGSGSMTIVDERTSTVESGAEVTVPTKRVNQFETKAAEFFRYWPRGSVLINGEEPTRVDGLWLTDSLLVTGEVSADVVVMGGVPYPFLDEFSESPYTSTPRFGGFNGHHRIRQSIVAFVDIGAVSFTPSRETLQATKGTKETLDRIVADAIEKRDEAVRRSVADATDARAAVAELIAGRKTGYKGEGTWRGKQVPTQLDRARRDSQGNRIHIDTKTATIETLQRLTFLRQSNHYVKGQRDFTLDLSDVDTYLVFEGFEGREMSPTKRDKLGVWRETKGIDPDKRYVMVDSLRPAEKVWLDGVKTYQWADVDAIKLSTSSKPANVNGRPRGAYDVLRDGTVSHVQAADLEDETNSVYWVGNNVHGIRYETAVTSGSIPTHGATIVALPANRIDKFKRDFPNVSNLNDAARLAAKGWLKRQDNETLRAYDFQSSNQSAQGLKGLDPTRILDPTLARGAELASKDVQGFREGLKRYSAFVTREPFAYGANLLDGYPLLGSLPYGLSVSRDAREHFYLYVNAVYQAARKEGKENA